MRKAIGLVSAGYAAGLAIMAGAHAVYGETHWLPVLLRYAPQVVFLIPATVLLLPALLLRSRTAVAVNAATCAYVLLVLMAPTLHAAPSVPEGAKTLRVLTYNVHAGLAGPQAVARFVRDAGADVVFLQEAREPKRGGPDPLPAIMRALPALNVVRGIRMRELAVLSRFPLSAAEERDVGPLRQALLCRVTVDGRDVRLVNVHLNTAATGKSLFRSGRHFREYLVHTAEVRRVQVEQLAAIVQEDGAPIVVAGDFNSPPRTHCHDVMRGLLDDVFERGGFGFGWTFSNRRPLWRIDHVFCGHGARPVSCEVPRVHVSDHLPVLAVVAL